MIGAIGLPLPSLWDRSAGKGVLVRDTSGSCAGDNIQSAFLGELNGVLENLKLEKLVVIDCDAKVQQVQTFTKYDLPLLKHELKGFGGTSFKPPFEWVAKKLDWRPDFLIYLTDMEGDFPESAPPYPVLWVTPTHGVDGPFGITANIVED